jgi:hypothetical protein
MREKDRLALAADIWLFQAVVGALHPVAPRPIYRQRLLLPDQQRVLGTNHPGILNTRGSIATGPAQPATYGGALRRLYQVLLPHAERVWGLLNSPR